MPNRLANEKSPYLLQHANNPVDWYPWGDEAIARARAEDRPIFLSVGYSTCHWCHVMERESFEDAEVARVMNDLFVNVKVDREERTDVDRVYMAFVQATTGGGGWPMSVWLTPDLKPFFGGTYFPPKDAHGRPGFRSICNKIGEMWRDRRSDLVKSGDQVLDALRRHEEEIGTPELLDRKVFDLAYQVFNKVFDRQVGGFGQAPKFPRPVTHDFLLRHFARGGPPDAARMVLATLWQMANSGMCDQLAGGFHRYSVDRYWHVPHFEKMLYDQAQLITSYLEAHQLTGEDRFAEVARQTCEYVLRDLTDAKTGGFWSAEDADSLAPGDTHKKEGAFYVFSKAELDQILTDPTEHEAFTKFFAIEPEGNADDPHGELTGKNVLHVTMPVDHLAGQLGKTPEEAEAILAAAKARVLAYRNQRPRPHLDDKILTAWNGMMIGALARAHQVLGEPRYLAAAERAATFAATTLWDGSRLRRRYREGEVAFDAYLDDHAQLASGLIDLYEAGFDTRWLLLAEQLADAMVTLFHDATGGGFFSTSGKDPTVLLRLKDDYDGAEPSGNSMAALVCVRLAHMLDRADLGRIAAGTFRCFSPRLKESPHAMPKMLVAMDLEWDAPSQVVIAAERAEATPFLRKLHARWHPAKVVLLSDAAARSSLGARLPWFAAMGPVEGKPAAYVCRDRACERPVTDPAALDGLLPHREVPENT